MSLGITITLTRTFTDLHAPVNMPVFYQQITATVVGDGDPAVFVYQIEPLDLTNSTTGSSFRGVTSLADYINLPASPPTDGTLLFRSSTVNAFYRSAEERDFVWTQLQRDVNLFVTGINGT